jgi:Tannase and feruloyl esterase
LANGEPTMLIKLLLTVGGACVLSGMGSRAGWARESDAVITAAADCKALESADFLDLPEAPTQVTEAKLVEPTDSAPGYCQVQGYVTPQVGFELRMPVANWNGKFLEIGCGGHCGNVGAIVACPLRKGYACITSDGGHKGTEGDGLWGYNNLQAKVDWGYRAPHVVALAGKALTEHYYQRRPSKSYFIGGSTGGRQALQEAQRFPWDFDGIVAIAPPVDLSTIYMTFAWGARVSHDKDGKPLLGKEDLKLLTDAAVAKCDMDDGVKDGVIGDPLHCAFDPAELICKGQQTSGCLTSVQVEAVKKIYSGPINSKGKQLTLGGPVVGSELGEWDKDPRIGWGFSYLGLGIDGVPGGYESLSTDGFRYLFFWPDPGPTWKLSDFDFDRDSRRMVIMQSLYDSSNPDLRRFKAAGGKVLVFQGLNDNSVLPRKTIDYYETVERTMGGRKETQSFCRLFILPGVGHGSGGSGADTIDYLTVLDAWVENDKVPDRLIAAHLKKHNWTEEPEFPLDPSQIQFTRPVYPYPTRAKYQGHGDPNDAANFGPADH